MVASSATAARISRGFSAEVSGIEARRQLRLSVAVVVMLSAGIVSAALAVGSHPLAAKRDIMSTVPVVTMHAEADPVGASPAGPEAI